MAHILVVDDEEAVCWALKKALGSEGHFRVTYGTRAENDRFLAVLDEVLAAL